MINITITSSAIPNNNSTKEIDIKHTKSTINSIKGENMMIPLSWNHVENATSYALICIDLHPKAKKWVHLYIPYIHITPKNKFNQSNILSSQSIIGKNSFNEYGYGGPQPPSGSGVHKYVFYLFALQNLTVDVSEKEECRNVEDFITNVVKDENKIVGRGIFTFYFSNP
jgi:Raf kinase inhibitor-like YbhB/YbcL family protein